MRKFFTFILIMWSVSVYAGDDARKGTTGADELLIPVGARSIATGGAFLSSVTGLEAIYYNPAGLSQGKGTEAMFSFTTYLADIKINYFAIGSNLGDFGSLALSVKTLNFGNIPVTTVDVPDGTGATYSPGYIVAGVTYAKVITDRVSVGVNAKVINETITDVSATGFAVDFGVQYRFPSNLSIGAAVKNIGTNMSFSGNSLQTSNALAGGNLGSPTANYNVPTEEFQLPSYFELSTAYDYSISEDNKLTVGAAFRNNNVTDDEIRLGLEYGFKNMFFLRGGYCSGIQNTSGPIANDNYGYTFGAGVNYGFADGMNFVLDYSFQQVREFPNPNHTFTIKLSLD
ncbi:MAG: PorV/PorQ family protein [Ignavibacteriaceae bacterium]|nr:PorV/PorQ family protein [Ignavibacteriaceae bacterium]